MWTRDGHPRAVNISSALEEGESLCPNGTHYPYQPLEDNILGHVPLIDLANVLPEKPKGANNRIADLKAEIGRRRSRSRAWYNSKILRL
jgi:hypothetical protein